MKSATELSVQRCKKSIILLSLELAMSVYEQMGFHILAGQKRDFVQVLRNLISEMGGSSVWIPIPDSLVRDVLHRIEIRLGPSVRNHYLEWVIYVYEDSPSEHPHTQAWSSILSWCATNPTRWSYLTLPIRLSSKLREEMEASTSWPDYEKLTGRSDALSLSEWDIQILEERKSEDGPWDARLSIECNVLTYRFRCVLKRLVEQLSETEVLSFWRSVQEIGLEQNLTQIKDIRGPNDLQEPQW